MIDTTPDVIWQEIQAGEKQRDTAIKPSKVLLRQFAGEANPDTTRPADTWPEAVTGEFLSYMVPRLVSGMPKVRCRSMRGSSDEAIEQMIGQMVDQVVMGEMELAAAEELVTELTQDDDEAEAIQHGLNYWIESAELHRTLDRMCYDYLLGWAVGLVRLVPMVGDAERRWPVVERVSPFRFMVDPECTHPDEAEWMGHWSMYSHADLEARAENDDTWDTEALARVKGLAWQESGVSREVLRVYEVWIRNHTEDDWEGAEKGFYGAWVTVAAGHSKKSGSLMSEVIRKPRPAFVPPWGPYTVGGTYVRPDFPYPLGPLAMTYRQQREFQLHSGAVTQSARDYKRILLVSDANPKLPEIIKSSPDSYVFSVPSGSMDRDQVIPVEIGGASDQQLTHYGVMKERLDRQLGMGDAQRGVVTGRGTATEQSIADSSAQTRVSYVDGKFNDMVRRLLRGVAWYMKIDDRVQFGIGGDAAQALRMIDPEFIGGIDSDSLPQIDTLSIEIEPYSMERTSEALLQQRVMTAYELIMQSAPIMTALPHVDWKGLMSKVGDALNIRDLENVIDWNEMATMAQMQQSQGVETRGGGESPQTQEANQRGRESAEAARVA